MSEFIDHLDSYRHSQEIDDDDDRSKCEKWKICDDVTSDHRVEFRHPRGSYLSIVEKSNDI